MTQREHRDWEEDLAKLVGDPLAFQIGYRVRQFKSQTQTFKQDSKQMLNEYVRYELDLLPARSELASFAKQVAELENHLNDLDARIQRMSNAINP
jgi:ubiquinone biosynthesis protein UbiJ